MTSASSSTSALLSRRANQITGSITMAITALAAQMAKDGKSVISFSIGEPDYGTPKNICDAGIRAIQTGKTRYTAASGIIELKQAVAKKLLDDNHLTYKPSDIVISCGAKQSLYNALLAVVDKGDEVIVPAPYWVSYIDQIELVDGTPVVVETTESTAFKLTPEQLSSALSPKSKVLMLNSPSNPTGMIYTKSELSALAEVILKHPRLVVISDEIYENLIYDDMVGHTSIAEISDEIKQRTIVINGVSKSHAMTGWRIGYAAAASEIADKMGQFQSHITSNPTTPSQYAATEALNSKSSELNNVKSIFNERRDLMVATLNTIPGISCLMPQGAFYTFPNVGECFGKTTKGGRLIADSASFCQAFLEEAYVACVPGSGFGTENYIRISYATSIENIAEGLNRLRQFVTDLS